MIGEHQPPQQSDCYKVEYFVVPITSRKQKAYFTLPKMEASAVIKMPFVCGGGSFEFKLARDESYREDQNVAISIDEKAAILLGDDRVFVYVVFLTTDPEPMCDLFAERLGRRVTRRRERAALISEDASEFSESDSCSEDWMISKSATLASMTVSTPWVSISGSSNHSMTDFALGITEEGSSDDESDSSSGSDCSSDSDSSSGSDCSSDSDSSEESSDEDESESKGDDSLSVIDEGEETASTCGDEETCSGYNDDSSSGDDDSEDEESEYSNDDEEDSDQDDDDDDDESKESSSVGEEPVNVIEDDHESNVVAVPKNSPAVEDDKKATVAEMEIAQLQQPETTPTPTTATTADAPTKRIAGTTPRTEEADVAGVAKNFSVKSAPVIKPAVRKFQVSSRSRVAVSYLKVVNKPVVEMTKVEPPADAVINQESSPDLSKSASNINEAPANENSSIVLAAKSEKKQEEKASCTPSTVSDVISPSKPRAPEPQPEPESTVEETPVTLNEDNVMVAKNEPSSNDVDDEPVVASVADPTSPAASLSPKPLILTNESVADEVPATGNDEHEEDETEESGCDEATGVSTVVADLREESKVSRNCSPTIPATSEPEPVVEEGGPTTEASEGATIPAVTSQSKCILTQPVRLGGAAIEKSNTASEPNKEGSVVTPDATPDDGQQTTSATSPTAVSALAAAALAQNSNAASSAPVAATPDTTAATKTTSPTAVSAKAAAAADVSTPDAKPTSEKKKKKKKKAKTETGIGDKPKKKKKAKTETDSGEQPKKKKKNKKKDAAAKGAEKTTDATSSGKQGKKKKPTTEADGGGKKKKKKKAAAKDGAKKTKDKNKKDKSKTKKSKARKASAKGGGTKDSGLLSIVGGLFRRGGKK